ncbi:hypothetical protein H4R35_002937 [Dimargaris xerosporica]|nr:hypothetical protein H4R35_002937 [Dimargaris xerosporica]
MRPLQPRQWYTAISKHDTNALTALDLSQQSTVDTLRNQLAQFNASPGARVRFKYRSEPLQEAAVLVPLCSIDGAASVLFTVRSMGLRAHQGEVSFPGGKRDRSDPDLLATCFRETQEEIGVERSRIEIIGAMPPVPNKDGSIKVYPFVGVLDHGQSFAPHQLKTNGAELTSLFTLSLAHLADPSNHSLAKFRQTSLKIPEFKTPEEVIQPIWGLTAFILDRVLRVFTRPGTHP